MTKTPPAEIQNLIEAHVNGFEDTAVIIGQGPVRTGTLAITFGQRDGVWKIEVSVETMLAETDVQLRPGEA